ncbi:cellulose biosynthesis cyclic di-GMP-binding regulatory protein BcsB [Rhizobiales bacterium RZME27]|uniref:Cyclic di-GMP-binding protein n=1 Tax=Endobacterium cereale TaxID=2663029 RepID=A0A6A8A4X1_9HYPH|nr:cellulose biosynthesis cyclic di-GMP-binding regulatory protein BcsB [Endobacterium cereale]MEB2845147.1 cellulose biosynthesis cyclic di-GMP-binding regulatory protein BcsB [Endobacterium cereale]MQY45919.1 cellulose biosynthesis cyclic di-GMP-binding regulatory protein BcsB [Endobacterium cereale]
MRKTCLAATLTLLTASCAFAQSAGFDMSGERPAATTPAPTAVSPQPRQDNSPLPAPTMPQQSVPGSAQVPAQAAPPPARQQGQTSPPSRVSSTGQAASQVFRRYIIPASSMVLEGEHDRHSWSIYVTPEQAASPARLNLGYQNAVVVAPEGSQITILVNNRVIGQQQVAASENPAQVSFAVPAGLLQQGVNVVTMRADQRHRTDCSIASTYDLWSNIDPANTYLTFNGSLATRLSNTDALRTVGVDETGATTFNMVVPSLDEPMTLKPVLRLTQGLSILSGMPSQKFEFQTDRLAPSSSGKLTVLVGTADELRPVFPDLPPAAVSAPIATFVDDRRTGQPVFVVSGPSWQSIASAVDSVVSPVDRPLSVQRNVISTQRWSAPDAPMLFSNANLSFSQLGMETLEFSGRRVRSGFTVGVPADFYAQGYGEATILLDAAYSQAVLPGSQINVYVNGNIASTVPITTSGGGILRHLPIRVTMRHFKPGVNTVEMETVLRTEEDEVCAPGASASTTPRFALFDTSEFQMPDFARIGQRPDLSSTVGTGYPYSRGNDATPLFLDRIDRDTLSATATLLSRMALAAGRPLAIEPIASANAAGDRDAIFVGSITQMPVPVLSQVNIATTSQAAWRPTAGATTENVNTGEVFDQWRDRVSGGNWNGQISVFQEWMQRNFDISLRSFRLLPGNDEPFAPSNAATFMIAQGVSPAGNGTWTVVTAPSSDDLVDGTRVMAAQEFWPRITGRVTTYSSRTGRVDNVAVEGFSFVPPTDTSVRNYRLIAANWLSTNVLYFAALFAAMTFLVGIATAALLSNLGRRK